MRPIRVRHHERPPQPIVTGTSHKLRPGYFSSVLSISDLHLRHPTVSRRHRGKNQACKAGKPRPPVARPNQPHRHRQPHQPVPRTADLPPHFCCLRPFHAGALVIAAACCPLTCGAPSPISTCCKIAARDPAVPPVGTFRRIVSREVTGDCRTVF